MLEVAHLTKAFGKTPAVRDVSFGIKAGEVYSLIGPNGSGKTTIIKLIAGLLAPTEGTITVEGYDAAKNPVQAKSRVGYIPDDPVIWSRMTGFELLHITGALYGVPSHVRRRKIPELLSLFGLEGIEHEYFEQYSRGNKQKFTILAALLHKPKVLLVDEPIIGLDPTSADIAERIFKKFAETGGAVLLATHTLPVAERIGSRIGVLFGGALVAEDTFAGLRTKAGVGVSAPLRDVYRALA